MMLIAWRNYVAISDVVIREITGDRMYSWISS